MNSRWSFSCSTFCGKKKKKKSFLLRSFGVTKYEASAGLRDSIRSVLVLAVQPSKHRVQDEGLRAHKADLRGLIKWRERGPPSLWKTRDRDTPQMSSMPVKPQQQTYLQSLAGCYTRSASPTNCRSGIKHNRSVSHRVNVSRTLV